MIDDDDKPEAAAVYGLCGTVIMLVLIVFLMTGCATDRSLLDRVEFDEDECGCARVQGQAKMSGNPFAGADAQVLVQKIKACEGQETPEC